MEYKLVKTRHSGVILGKIESRNGQHVVMTDARLLFNWEGSTATLIDLAQRGTCNPERCIVTEKVNRIEVFDVVMIVGISETALESLCRIEKWG